MNNERYNVLWTIYAREALARMGKLKVNSANVFKLVTLLILDYLKNSLTSQHIRCG